MTSWYGLLVPAKTPRRVIADLYREASQALRLADVREQMERQGLEIASRGPREFAAQIRDETLQWTKVIRVAGIRTE